MVDLKVMNGQTIDEMKEAQAEAGLLTGWDTDADADDAAIQSAARVAKPLIPAFWTLDVDGDFYFERGATLTPAPASVGDSEEATLAWASAELKSRVPKGWIFVGARALGEPEAWMRFQPRRISHKGYRKPMRDKDIVRTIRWDYDMPAIRKRDLHIARENPGGSLIWVTPVAPVYGKIEFERDHAYSDLVEGGLSVWEWLELYEYKIGPLSESEMLALGGDAVNHVSLKAVKPIMLAAATAAVSTALVGDDASPWFTEERLARERRWMQLTQKVD